LPKCFGGNGEVDRLVEALFAGQHERRDSDQIAASVEQPTTDDPGEMGAVV
jgi:hypothetical protein